MSAGTLLLMVGSLIDLQYIFVIFYGRIISCLINLFSVKVNTTHQLSLPHTQYIALIQIKKRRKGQGFQGVQGLKFRGLPGGDWLVLGFSRGNKRLHTLAVLLLVSALF